MSWDPRQSPRDLTQAADSLDRPRVNELCGELIAHVRAHDEPYPLTPALAILGVLRRRRHFLLLQRTADAFIQTGLDNPTIRRQYAQALIDRENLTAAVAVLDRLIGETAGQGREDAEARGLLGRAYKQMFVATGPAAAERRARLLERAIAPYLAVWSESRAHWHGINAVALLMRSHQEGIRLPGVDSPEADAQAIAREILDAIEGLGDAATAWDQGNALEASMALGDSDAALEHLDAYLATGPDAFEMASTLRQLTEVWALDATSPLVSVLKAALLDYEGPSDVTVGSTDIEAAATERIAHEPSFEKLLGSERFESLRWFQTALERCRGVARIEDPLEGPVGSAFLVDGASIHSTFPPVVLVTNAHVISPDSSLAPDRALVTFRALEDATASYGIARILWSSAPTELDTTIVELDGRPANATSAPVARRRPQLDVSPPPRTYIIGHPSGADQVMLSVADNQLLDADDVRVHYRTPTMGGSSGSPVFNRSWELIAVHHSGSTEMPRLHGKGGTYPANEGIWLERVAAEVKRALG